MLPLIVHRSHRSASFSRTPKSSRSCDNAKVKGLAIVAFAVTALATPPPGSGVSAASADPRLAAAPCRSLTTRPLGSQRLAYVALAHGPLAAHQRPGGPRIARFRRLNVNGVRTVFGVLGVARRCAASWYRVQLPMRPNGVVGYVRARDVALATVRTRIVVDLSRRELTLFRAGHPVLRTRVAVGSPATPTPVGRFYVNQRLVPANPGGPFGPSALGISAFSEVLTGWAQGGPVAIHGTNKPWLIGQAVTNGCIRVRNAVQRRLFHATLAGTPVLVRP